MTLLSGFLCSFILGLISAKLASVYIQKLSKNIHSKRKTKIKDLLLYLTTAFSYVFVFAAFGFSFTFFLYVLLTFILITISWIDYYDQIIPDTLSLALIVSGFLLSAFNTTLGDTHFQRILSSVIGILLSGFALIILSFAGNLILKKETFGGGDIKLFAGTGAFIGYKYALIPFCIACLLAIIVFLPLIIFKKKKINEYIPFGPFLAIGAYLTALLRQNDIFNTIFEFFTI